VRKKRKHTPEYSAWSHIVQRPSSQHTIDRFPNNMCLNESRKSEKESEASCRYRAIGVPLTASQMREFIVCR
jgi:hypothetical protein